MKQLPWNHCYWLAPYQLIGQGVTNPIHSHLKSPKNHSIWCDATHQIHDKTFYCTVSAGLIYENAFSWCLQSIDFRFSDLLSGVFALFAVDVFVFVDYHGLSVHSLTVVLKSKVNAHYDHCSINTTTRYIFFVRL